MSHIDIGVLVIFAVLVVLFTLWKTASTGGKMSPSLMIAVILVVIAVISMMMM